MTEKELREIKRRFRPEKSNIPRIVGCFVNSNKQIIASINQSLELGDSAVSERLLSVMKKVLSGSLGTNLTDIVFSTRQVTDSEEHKLLMALRSTSLSDKEVLSRFYDKVISSVSFEGNYVILLANDIYDVFSHSSDGEKAESSEQFSYIICAVCPIKESAEAICFREADSLFHSLSASSLLASPELGFMFPAFDDRRTNIYGALYYTRSIAESYAEFTEQIFGSEPPMPPKVQKATFNECLTTALEGECSLELVRSVHNQVDELIQSYKDSGAPEPLKIDKAAVKSILENCGIAEEKIENVSRAFDESFGQGAELTPKNVVAVNKFEMSLPDVKIKVDPEHRDIISTQIINDVKYVMIRVEGNVEVNGINIDIE